MNAKRIFRTVSGLLIVVTLLLSACGGGSAPTDASPSTDAGENNTGNTDASESKPATQEPTPTPEPTFPDMLALHPDAYDIEILTATDTYIYYLPMMVAEVTEYLLTELEALGWEGLGKPTVMGHLATINMQREDYRLTISMQDNDHTQSTRIQMILLEK
jgi:hypothetical protein